MKKNTIIVMAVIAAVCFITVFYMLLTGAASATTALPFAIIGCVCALLAGRDPVDKDPRDRAVNRKPIEA